MAYDEYFTDSDKPYAENLNDSLLLLDAFDVEVPVELPGMFGNGDFSSTVDVPRKCGVGIVTLKSVASGVTVGTDSISGSGAVVFRVYPNFNSFYKWQSIVLNKTGTVSIGFKKTDGTSISATVSNDGIISEASALKELQEIDVVLTLTSATISNILITFVNNQTSHTRTGALLEAGNLVNVNGTVAANDTQAVSGATVKSAMDSAISTAIATAAPTNHKSSSTTYGVGDSSNYGHVKVDSSLSGSSTNPVQNKMVTNIVKYELSASNYNPTIDSSVTITVKAVNQLGNSMSNHTFDMALPYTPGTQQDYVTLTTNSSGVATYSYTCSDWGVCGFSVGPYTCFINVTGWKTYTDSTNYVVKYNDKLVYFKFSYTGSAGSLTTDWWELGANVFQDDWIKPQGSIVFFVGNPVIANVRKDNSKIRVKTLTGTIPAPFTLEGETVWKRR